MKNITASSLALALFVLLAPQAQATPNPQFEQGARVRAIVKTLPGTPADWRFIVVDEIQWKSIMQTSGTALESHSAVSNLKARITFIREGYAVAATDYLLRQTLAHEMGHRICDCQDEVKANFYRNQILATVNLR